MPEIKDFRLKSG